MARLLFLLLLLRMRLLALQQLVLCAEQALQLSLSRDIERGCLFPDPAKLLCQSLRMSGRKCR